MRMTFTPPTENDFKQLFLSSPLRKGGGIDDINIFQPRSIAYRRGSGILSFISGVAKRVLPLLIKAAKPAAKEFGTSMVKDIMQGKKPIRRSLKDNGINALKQTGLRLIRGSGKVVKKKKNIRKRGNNKKTKRKKQSHGYKNDIFKIL